MCVKIVAKVIYLTFCLIFVHITIRDDLNKIHGFLLKNREPNSYFHGCSALLLCCSKANYIKIPCIFSVYCKNSQKFDILRVIKWYN